MFLNNDNFQKVFKYLSIFKTGTKDSICKFCKISSNEFDDMFNKNLIFKAQNSEFFSLRPNSKVNMNAFHLSWIAFLLNSEDFPIFNTSPDNITFISSDRKNVINAVYVDSKNIELIKEYVKHLEIPVLVVSTVNQLLTQFDDNENLKKVLLSYNDTFSMPKATIL